jgi:hypothetical protein
MKTENLKLGNYVRLSDDYTFVITQVPAGTVCKVEAIKRNYLYLECKVGDGVCYSEVPVSMVEPIPLTEELLLKSGFTKEYNGFCNDIELSYGRYLYNDGVNDAKLFVSINSAEYPLSNIPIEYLHQLQNIYFDLTGKELE